MEDVPEVASLHAAAWKVAFRGILSDELLDDFGGYELEEGWKEILKRTNRINLLFEQQGKVAGLIAFQEYPDTNTEGEIIGIYVSPESWRKGIGSKLIRKAVERMKEAGFTDLYLWTMTQNQISNRFYLKEGFEKTDETKTSIRSGESFEETKYKLKIEENQSLHTAAVSAPR